MNMKNVFLIAMLALGSVSFANVNTLRTEVVTSSEEKVTVFVEGMSCAMGCANTIEKTLNATAGISSASVDFEAGTAEIVYNPEVISKDEILKTINGVNGGETYTASFEKASSPKKACCSSKSGKSSCGEKGKP